MHLKNVILAVKKLGNKGMMVSVNFEIQALEWVGQKTGRDFVVVVKLIVWSAVLSV